MLDAGCGSGRDSKVFLGKGYKVTAFDAGETMANLAAEYAGIPVLRLRFDQLRFEERFDGVWACASLLHVPRHEMDGALFNLYRSLKPGGIFYASFRYGYGETVGENLLFTNYTEETFREQLRNHPDLEAIRFWHTVDQRPDHPNTIWLNVLLRRRA